MIDTLLILGLVIVICILAINLALSRQNRKFLERENIELSRDLDHYIRRNKKLSSDNTLLSQSLTGSLLINKQFENSFKPR